MWQGRCCFLRSISPMGSINAVMQQSDLLCWHSDMLQGAGRNEMPRKSSEMLQARIRRGLQGGIPTKQEISACLIVRCLCVNEESGLTSPLCGTKVRSRPTSGDSKADGHPGLASKLEGIVLGQYRASNAFAEVPVPQFGNTVEEGYRPVIFRERGGTLLIKSAHNSTFKVERLPASEANAEADRPEPLSGLHRIFAPDFIGHLVRSWSLTARLRAGSGFDLQESWDSGRTGRARSRPPLLSDRAQLVRRDTLGSFLCAELLL